MKKIVALALTVVMVIGLLAGCQKPMDAQTLAQKMDEAMKAQTAVGGKMNMEMDMSMAMTGMSLDMGIDLDVDLKSTMAAEAAYVGATMSMEVLGQSESFDMEIYMQSGEEGVVSYVHSGIDDSWTKSVSAIPETNSSAMMSLTEVPVENLTLAEEKVLLNEKEYYHLTVVYTGEQMSAYMDEAMATAGEDLDEETTALMDSIDWTLMSMSMVYYVDPETFLPVQMEGEVLGLGDMMNGMLAGALAEAMLGVGMDEMELTIDIPTCKAIITDVVYGDVEIPEVPQEGVEAAALNPLQEDGSYVLRSGEEAVRIELPEGYEGVAMDSQTLAVYNADYTVNAMYAYVAEMTGEDLRLSFEEELIYYQEEEEGAYANHAYGEFNGFTTVILRLTDGSAIYYAWKDTAEGVFYVAVNAMGPIDTPDVFLECVSAYEG